MPYEEIDYTFSSHGERVCSHPGVSDAHDETECARCGTLVAHRLGEDPETGWPTEGWVPCYSGPLGIVCEDCAVALDPVDARNFDLGDILSITTSRLVSPRGISGVYDILDYMTGDSLFTHALPRAGEVCKPVLLEQHPALNNVVVPDWDALPADPGKAVDEWMVAMRAEHGDELPVTPLTEWQHINPIEELAQMMGGTERIVVVEVEDEADDEPEEVLEVLDAPTQLVGFHVPSEGDVIGMLLGKFADGWWCIASHISSDGQWSKHDIGFHAAKHPDIPYEWVGSKTSDEAFALYPPPDAEGDK